MQNSQAAPVLVAESYAVVADDGDGAIEPNECVDITITLRNDGDAATNVSGTLTSNTAGVTVPVANATQSYPDIPGGSTGTNSFPFGVSLSSVFACGLSANLTLVVTTDQGTFPVSVTLGTGNVPPLSQSFNESPNKNIKDGRGQVNRSHGFAGITTIVKVTASVHITHSQDSDLAISLIGPDGTNVDLSSNNGGTGQDYGTSCGAQTTFDDGASTSITAGTAPFSGNYKPESTLSVFNGKTGTAANGNWRLRVRDTVRNGLKGKLECWSITIYYASVCGDGGTCPGSVDVVKFSSADVISGNLVADVNDCFDLSVGLRNDGTATADGIMATTLTTTTPGVTILQGTSDYPAISEGATQVNTTAFQVEAAPSVACGTMIDFVLSGSSASGGPFSIQFQVPVGQSQSVAATGPSAIPDGDSNGAELSIPVSGITGTVGKATLDLHVTHTNDADLTISLVGPDNTTVVLSSGNGGSEDDYGLDCEDPTRFDDDASVSITNGTAPFEGVFIPEEALAAFDGKDPNGTWKVRVVDNNSNGEVGDIECATLKFLACIDGDCCPTITLDDTLADVVAGSSYDGLVTAAGGTEPYTFEVTSGSLPTGLSLDSSGSISGTPSEAGSFTFEVTATDAHGCLGTLSYEVEISTCLTLTLDDTLPDGTAGVSYSGTILASGGTEPYSYAHTDGTLPTGVTLNTDGALSGTPTVPGTFDFEVTATDANGCTGSASYSVQISCATVTLNDTLPDGVSDAAYSGSIVASGSTSVYTYVLTSGSLPAGIILDSSGSLTGTPVTSGSYDFTVSATDAFDCTGSALYNVVIGCPVITVDQAEDPGSPVLPAGTINTPYSTALTASGGSSPYTFTTTDTFACGIISRL